MLTIPATKKLFSEMMMHNVTRSTLSGIARRYGCRRGQSDQLEHKAQDRFNRFVSEIDNQIAAAAANMRPRVERAWSEEGKKWLRNTLFTSRRVRRQTKATAHVQLSIGQQELILGGNTWIEWHGELRLEWATHRYFVTPWFVLTNGVHMLDFSHYPWQSEHAGPLELRPIYSLPVEQH